MPPTASGLPPARPSGLPSRPSGRRPAPIVLSNPRGVWEVRAFPVRQGGAVVLLAEVGLVRRAAELRQRFVQDLSHERRGLHFNLIQAHMEEELKARAERQRTWAKGLSYAGFGLLITSIFFGIQETAKQQEADLYSGINPDRAHDAQKASDMYSSLLISSLVLAGGLFTFSFVKTVQYFNTYNRVTDYGVPIVGAEVAF